MNKHRYAALFCKAPFFTTFTTLFCTALCIAVVTGPALAQQVDDAAIITRVESAIANSEDLAGAEIHVTSVNGHVLLTGQALDAGQKQQASVAVAFATNAMRRLINEIEVVAAIDNSFHERDLALQSDIEDAIENLTHRTSVVVHNGTVHLLGQVSRDEGNAVALKASTLPGVKTVRLSFEFTD